MGFEDRFLSGIDRKRTQERMERSQELRNSLELPPIISRARERLQREVFTNREYAIQATDFFNVYGEDGVRKDMLEVLRLQKIFDKNSAEKKREKMLSDVFEGLVLVNAKHHNWFGDADLYKTSKFDDYKNGTDMYGEWYGKNSGTNVLALAVDLTFSSAKSAHKLDAIKQDIDQGRLREIRYFKDARGNFKGTYFNVPRIVLGVATHELADMANLWMNGKEDRLSKHPVRIMLIKEMYLQAQAMHAYAQKMGKTEIVSAYERALAIITPLYEEIERGPKLEARENDPVLKVIEQKVSQFQR